jgi:hypothetical protein
MQLMEAALHACSELPRKPHPARGDTLVNAPAALVDRLESGPLNTVRH